VEFRHGDGVRMPIGPGTMDFLVSTLSLHHWRDPAPVLRDIYRVLRPGGRFVILDLRRDARRFVYWLMAFAQAFVVPAPMRRMREPLGSLHASYTPAEIAAVVARSGFGGSQIRGGAAWMFVWDASRGKPAARPRLRLALRSLPTLKARPTTLPSA